MKTSCYEGEVAYIQSSTKHAWITLFPLILCSVFVPCFLSGIGNAYYENIMEKRQAKASWPELTYNTRGFF